ncbi:fibropellin-1-like [Saccostrea cucullata]|uniref:fibropellin-1-like n=1 Tax=Saccostrea cuccullata TaxID=36930 RepID=UPI002ED423A3
MQTGKILLVFLVGYITSLQAETLTKRSNTPLADSKPNTCQNGGTYTRIQISTLPRGPKFICTCPEGFSGIVCQFQVCDKHDCQNGTCEADQTNTRGYKCNCIEG